MKLIDETIASQEPSACAAESTEVYIHPLADVEEGACLGPGTKVWRFAHIRAGAAIGANCLVSNSAYIDAGVCIGDGVKIQNGVLIYAGVTVEDEAFLGPHVTFTNDLYPRAVSPDWCVTPTRVCRGASIGANATVVCGITIGSYAMVAAGSVVTRDVPAFGLVRGNPARLTGYVCCCGHKLLDTPEPLTTPLTCMVCGKTIGPE